MIVYGRNHFLSKKVLPIEIGLRDEQYKGLHFELRQKYAHLYWIPIFPLGQEWFLKRNGELYHLDYTVERAIKSKFPSVMDWKAFALPLLLLLGLILYVISNKIGNYNYERNRETENSLTISKMKSQLDSLDSYSYLEFNKEQQKLYYKVSMIKKDSLQLIEFESPLPETASFFVKTNSETDLLYLKFQIAKIADTVWINRKDLANDIKDESSSKIKKIRTSKSVIEMELNDVVRFDDAKFIEDTSPESKSIYYFEIQNIGLDAHIDSITSDKKEDWTISKKRNVSLLDKFAIKTENGTEASLHYTTTQNNKKHVLKLTRVNGHLLLDYRN
jgi:hypothetical protein